MGGGVNMTGRFPHGGAAVGWCGGGTPLTGQIPDKPSKNLMVQSKTSWSSPVSYLMIFDILKPHF